MFTKREILEKINELDSKLFIELKVDNIRDFYKIQQFAQKSRDCHEKDLGVSFDKKNNVVKIFAHRIRKEYKLYRPKITESRLSSISDLNKEIELMKRKLEETKEVLKQRQQECIKYNLNESL